jgi:hypothetical protein
MARIFDIQEAKTKVCPFIGTVNERVKSTTMRVGEAQEVITESDIEKGVCNCLGDQCMAWKPKRDMDDRSQQPITTGYCVRLYPHG